MIIFIKLVFKFSNFT